MPAAEGLGFDDYQPAAPVEESSQRDHRQSNPTGGPAAWLDVALLKQ